MNKTNKSTKNENKKNNNYSFQAANHANNKAGINQPKMKINRIKFNDHDDNKYNDHDDKKLSLVPENINNEGVIDTFDLKKQIELFKIAKERDEQDAKKEFVPKTEVNYSTPYGTDPVDQRLAEQRVIAANNNNTYDYESYVIYYYYLSSHIYMI